MTEDEKKEFIKKMYHTNFIGELIPNTKQT